jgi:hypothetical protein
VTAAAHCGDAHSSFVSGVQLIAAVTGGLEDKVPICSLGCDWLLA